MPKPRETRWTDLRLGITVVSVTTLALLAVFLLGARRGPFLPDTYTLYLELDDAGGIRVGSPVRVGGVTAGEVSDVEIVAPREAPVAPHDTLQALVGGIPQLRDIRITLAIQQEFRPYVTTSSRAQLASLGMGGERYVQIGAGDVREAALRPGDVIAVEPSVDWDLVIAQISRALNEGTEIVYLSKQLRRKIESGSGTLPRLLSPDAPLYGDLRTLASESKALLRLLDTGPGVLARARTDPTLASNIDSLRTNVAAIEAALEEGDGTLHRWADRTELDAALKDLHASVADLDARLSGGRGTLGRLLNDRELWLQVRVLQRRTSALVEAFRADPLGFVNIQIF